MGKKWFFAEKFVPGRDVTNIGWFRYISKWYIDCRHVYWCVLHVSFVKFCNTTIPTITSTQICVCVQSGTFISLFFFLPVTSLFLALHNCASPVSTSWPRKYLQNCRNLIFALCLYPLHYYIFFCCDAFFQSLFVKFASIVGHTTPTASTKKKYLYIYFAHTPPHSIANK